MISLFTCCGKAQMLASSLYAYIALHNVVITHTFNLYIKNVSIDLVTSHMKIVCILCNYFLFLQLLLFF